jgi:uncharacterized OB-fold protein
MPDGWAQPAVDQFNAGFFTSGRLVLQECVACGTVQHPPEEACHRCQGMEFRGRETAGRGTIHSYIVVRHPVAPALAAAVPYAVVLVVPDEFPHVRIVGNVLNRAADEVSIGQRVRAVFEALPAAEGEPAVLLPQWEVED